MTAGLDLERRLTTWFEDQAPATAPDRVLAASLERVATLPQRRSIGRRAGWAWEGLSRRRRVAIVLAGTVALLVGTLAVGAWLVQQLPRPPALVVIVADGTFPDPVGLTVQAVEADGSTRTLGSWTAEILGGSYSDGGGVALSADGHLAVPVSMPAGTSEFRIVDLRDPSVPPRTPDAESMFGAWGPGDRFAMIVNAGGYVAYDAHTGASVTVATQGPGPREIAFRPVWTSDGSGIHANGVPGATNGFGVLRLDGTTVPGALPEFPTGLGPRRTAPDGARIQCSLGEDFGCEDEVAISRNTTDGSTELWLDDRPDVRIADFATTVDGDGLWLLLETVAPTARTVTLVHRTSDGGERPVTMFEGEPDDPDEASYFPAASIAALAPDDSRLVISLAGSGGSFGTRWSIDLTSGARQALDGAPAGWLGRDTLTAPRPTVDPIVESDPALRGEWSTTLTDRVGTIPEGAHGLAIRRSSASLDAGFGQDLALQVSADARQEVTFMQERAAIGCEAGSTARYRWVVEAGSLRLEAIDDACAARRLLLENVFEAVLPSGDTGPRSVAPDTTLLVSRFAVPFRLTTPGSGLFASRHDAEAVSVSESADGGFVQVVPASSGAADPCDRFSPAEAIPPGLDAAIAFVEGRASVGVGVERLPDVTVGDLAGPTFRLTGSTSCDRGVGLFSHGGRALMVQDGGTVTLIEPRPGQVVAIIVSPPGPDPAWLEDLLHSIDFVDPPGS
jgi:hypothetical protein